MKINNIEIKQEIIDAYIQHFDKNKKDIWTWEHNREKLHLSIFKEAGFKNPKKDRHTTKGQEFSKELDKYCIPKIEKLDYFVAGLKKITSSDDEMERFEAKLQLENRIMYEKILKRKAEEKKETEQMLTKNTCRQCGKELVEGIGRVNDHLAPSAEDYNIKNPICSDCSRNNPDEYHNKFRKMYWSK